MTAQDGYKRLVGEFVKPALKQHGFRSRAGNFFVFEEGNWGLISLQKHGLSSSQKLLFTVNVGVASARLSSRARDVWSKLPPKEYECDLRMRLGHLMPEQRDKWWTVELDTDISQLASEVLGAIESFGIPALRRHISDEALRDLWLRHGGWLTPTEHRRKLDAMLRAIGPADLLTQVDSEEEARKAEDQGHAEVVSVLLGAGFQPLGDDTFLAPAAHQASDAPSE